MKRRKSIEDQINICRKSIDAIKNNYQSSLKTKSDASFWFGNRNEG